MRGRLGASHNGLIFNVVSTVMLLKGNPDAGQFRRRIGERFGKAMGHPLPTVAAFLATLPYSATCRLLNRSTQMVVVARKPG